MYQRITGAHTVDLAEQSAAVTQRLVAPLLRGLAIEDPHSTSDRTGAMATASGRTEGSNTGPERRPVTSQLPQPLVRALRWHVAAYGAARDGRLFVARGYREGPVSLGTYTTVWRKARALVLGDETRSLGAKVPYQLRHAAVSTWLNAGVPATQVAEWAGHSVHVLLKVYAKCIDGQDEAARRRIEDALGIEREDQKDDRDG